MTERERIIISKIYFQEILRENERRSYFIVGVYISMITVVRGFFL